ncbi:hypothetical protein BT96DRAFT_845260, partial [Gymnopus androsaceus JB14]
MTPDISIFESPPTPCAPKQFRTANKDLFEAKKNGNVEIPLVGGNPLPLPNTLYVLEIANTLISVGTLDDAGYYVTFGGGQAVITDPDGIVVGTIPKTDGLYRVLRDAVGESHAAIEKVSLDELHRQMGHISPSAAKKLVTGKFVDGVELN